MGKQLNDLDKQQLLSIACGIWAKNELRSIKFLNEDKDDAMIKRHPKSWKVSVGIEGDRKVCEINLIENDSLFEVTHKKFELE